MIVAFLRRCLLFDSYIIQTRVPRFGTGEAKGEILESVRGDDIYLLVDVTNYSLTYSLCGQENHMSPDDHFQDLKRIIAAIGGKSRRITVIMPYLYESRQHKCDFLSMWQLQSYFLQRRSYHLQ